MYQRILLATDASLEGLTALREGAQMARALRARVHLLVVTSEPVGALIAGAAHVLPTAAEASELLQTGLDRLAKVGVSVTGEVLIGEPGPLIAAAARAFCADLIVIGHRKKSFLERWWSGHSGAYLLDHLACSILTARNVVSDDLLAREAVDDMVAAPIPDVLNGVLV